MACHISIGRVAKYMACILCILYIACYIRLRYSVCMGVYLFYTGAHGRPGAFFPPHKNFVHRIEVEEWEQNTQKHRRKRQLSIRRH